MGVHDVHLRPEQPRDADAIRDVVVSAFELPVIGELVDCLRASPDWVNGLSFVAERDGRIIGHVLFTRSLLDAPLRLVDVLVLGPVSVMPAEQGGVRIQKKVGESNVTLAQRRPRGCRRHVGTEDCSVGFGRGR